MSNYPKAATDAPYELGSDLVRWIYDDTGRQYPIVTVSRRRVLVDRYGARISLKRRNLERDGFDTANGVRFTVSPYLITEQERTA